MRFAEEKKVVPILASANYGAGVTLDSINMKNFHRASIIITFGAVTGNAGLLVYSGATAAATTSAIVFDSAVTGANIAAASGDVLGATTRAVAASGLTLTAGTYGSRMAVLEIDAANMDVANGEEWLTLVIDGSASSGIAHAVAILEPRYTSGQSITATA